MSGGWILPLLIAGYGGAAALWLRRLGRGDPRQVARTWLTAVFIVQTAYLVARWVAIGHPPLFGTFENVLAAGWTLAAMVLWGAWRGSGWRDLAWASALPWLVILPAWGLRYPARLLPLTISERSLWVDIHVLFAWVAFDVVVLAVGTSGLVVARERWPSRLTWVPAAEAVDLWLFRAVTLAFIGTSLVLATGSYYSVLLFGAWVRWEVVQVSSIVLWLALAMIVHARLFYGWKGAKLAWAVLAVLPVALTSYWVWSVYRGTYHSFDIPLLRAGDTGG